MEVNEQGEYPKPIMNEIALLDRLKEKAVALVGPVIAAERVIESIKPEEAHKFNVGIGVSPGDIQGALLFAFNPSSGEITKILRRLADLGYRQTGEPLVEPNLRRKRWTCGDVHVIASFWGDEASCRFVQVGTEEKPIMELQCDD